MVETVHKYLILTKSPDAETTARWEDFLCNADFATHYVTPDFFSDPFAGPNVRFVILAVNNGQIDAVLSGVRQGKSLTSGMAVRPQTAFRCGIDRASASSALTSALAEFDDAADMVNFYSWLPIDGLNRFGYEHEICSGADRVVMLDLSKGPEALFKDFSERRRTDLRKTMKQAKLEVKRLNTEAELAELYEIHTDWNLRKGNKADSWEAFQVMISSKHRAVFIALHEGKIIAGTYLRFCEGGVVEYAANNSLEEFQKLRPNELIGWRAIEWACSAGFEHFSLGASHTFLARFGGELIAAHRYRLDRTFFKRHNNRERVSRLAVKTYLSLPESVRRRIKSATLRI